MDELKTRVIIKCGVRRSMFLATVSMTISFFINIGGMLKHDVFMLNFLPQLKDTDFSSKQEFIFLIDRSGKCYRKMVMMVQ